MTTSIQSYHNNVRQFFTKSAEEHSRKTKFVQRESKISGSIFLQGLVWGVYLFGKITLAGLGGIIERLHPEVYVSDQGLDQRFNEKAIVFMKAMFALAMQQTLGFPAESLEVLTCFSAVYLLDSSTVSLPESLMKVFLGCGGNGSNAAAKVFLLLDWLKGGYEAIRVENGRQPDQNMGIRFLEGKSAGALWLFDLGFWNLLFLKGIVSKGGYFLTRLQSQVSLSVSEMGRIIRLDLDLLLSKVDCLESVFEIDVVLGANHSVSSRLICFRLPEQVASERRRKAREKAKKQGKTLSQRALKRLDWSLYVTNAPKAWISTEAVEVVYRIRWQVELAFKLSKTDAALDKINSEKRERVLCEFYAKLISLCFFHALMALLDEKGSLSYPKAWRRLKDDLISFGKSLHKGRGLAELKALLSYLERHSSKSRRKKYPSTLQRVLEVQQLSWIRQMVTPVQFIEARSSELNMQLQRFFVDYCAIPEGGAA